MKKLIAVVEGPGDKAAVPGLLARVLHRLERFDWVPDGEATYAVGALAAFRKHLDRYLRSIRQQAIDGVLVLLDLDDAGQCPVTEARTLAEEIRAAGLPIPVAVVFAYREYEAWLLASLPTTAAAVEDLPDGAEYPDDPESPRDCKAPLSALLPPGRIYRERLDQKPFTQHLDLDLAASRSRSFRRLLHAVDELTAADGPVVTPAPG